MATVDPTRDSRFVECLVALLAQVEITEVAHLVGLDFSDLVFEHPPNGGKIGCLRKAIKKATAEAGVSASVDAVAPRGDDAISDERLQQAFLKAFGKDQPKVEPVEVAKKLQELGLDSHVPSDLWPPMNAVRELNHKLKTMKKAGFASVFIEVELRKFLPAYFPEHFLVVLDLEEAREMEAVMKKSKGKRLLDPATWQVAWDRYAIAAAVLGQLSYAGASYHKSVVMEIAAMATKEGNSPCWVLL